VRALNWGGLMSTVVPSGGRWTRTYRPSLLGAALDPVHVLAVEKHTEKADGRRDDEI
jgi:hypothetical protein